MRRSCWLVVAALACALVAGCGGSGSADRSADSPPAETPSTGAPRTPPRTTPPQAGKYCLQPRDHGRNVRFGPHEELGGFATGPGHDYVVLLHQSDGDACQMLPIARMLARAGYRSLAFDSSGRGASGAARYDHRTLADDVTDAVRFARGQGATSVSLVGTSMGGYGVLAAALTITPPVNAVVSLSAPDVWDDPSGKALDISALTVPTQLWAARLDSGFAEAAKRFASQDPDAALFLRPGSDHGVDLFPAAFPTIRPFLAAHTRGSASSG